MLRELEAMGFTDSTTADPTTTPISEGEVKDNTDTNMWAYGPDGEKMRMNGEFFNNPDKPNNPKIQEDIVKALAAMNFEHVSRTQHSVLPVVLAHFDPTKGPNEQAPGNHCIIQGPAGTGKTMAFILGTMSQIDRKLKTPQVIVIADTQELAEQNQQQADFFAWESEEVGNQIKYKLKGDKKVSRFGDSPDQEIHTEKLVGGMSPPWEQRLGQGGRMNPNFKGQYVSVTKGILENLLKKKDGKYTPLACEFLKDVRMVVIDEADKLWSNGGIQGLEKNFLVPICAARNQGKKANTKKARENLVKTQFIFVSATFVPSDRTPLRDACVNLKKKGYGMELKEVYLSNKDLLLKKVKQFYIPCENYQSQYTALYNICQSIKNVSKSILIIPMGEEVVSDGKSGKRRAIGQNDEMDRIYDYLTQHETPLELVDRFSATRVATDSEKNDRNVRKNKRGRVKYTEAERVKKMEAFKRQEIKHMIATSMDRGVNVKACKSTHVFFFEHTLVHCVNGHDTNRDHHNHDTYIDHFDNDYFSPFCLQVHM